MSRRCEKKNGTNSTRPISRREARAVASSARRAADVGRHRAIRRRFDGPSQCREQGHSRTVVHRRGRSSSWGLPSGREPDADRDCERRHPLVFAAVSSPSSGAQSPSRSQIAERNITSPLTRTCMRRRIINGVLDRSCENEHAEVLARCVFLPMPIGEETLGKTGRCSALWDLARSRSTPAAPGLAAVIEVARRRHRPNAEPPSRTVAAAPAGRARRRRVIVKGSARRPSAIQHCGWLTAFSAGRSRRRSAPPASRIWPLFHAEPRDRDRGMRRDRTFYHPRLPSA
jgi:hypothetical protein